MGGETNGTKASLKRPGCILFRRAFGIGRIVAVNVKVNHQAPLLALVVDNDASLK
jgi:hypothetical protein